MTTARAQILDTLKTALRRYEREPDAARQRLRVHAANLVPARGGDPKGGIELFTAEAVQVDASVIRIGDFSELPAVAAAFLSEHNLPATLRAASSLENVPWAGQPTLDVAYGLPQADDMTGISMAFGGVAETGTLVFLSGPENPTTLNYLTPNHIAVVGAADICGDYEAIWRRIRSENTGPNGSFMPRSVNWVTGPSRSADIEQTLLLGAHGPQRLHIVIVDEKLD